MLTNDNSAQEIMNPKEEKFLASGVDIIREVCTRRSFSYGDWHKGIVHMQLFTIFALLAVFIESIHKRLTVSP